MSSTVHLTWHIVQGLGRVSELKALYPKLEKEQNNVDLHICLPKG